MTDLRVTLLGTAAAQPTLRRGLSATAVRAHGDRFLVDCGEGTQRQLLRFGGGFGLDYVLFTHFHADHYLGIIGFVRTLAMGGRTEPLTLYGPAPFIQRLPELVHVGGGDLGFPVDCVALQPGEVVQREHYRVQAVRVDHRGPALGYVLEEPERPGPFDVQRALALGVPAGPLFGQLQRGAAVTLPSGQVVQPADVLGASRPGRKVVFSGDTRPCRALIEAGRDADLFIHESTFSERERARALETRHSTAHEAALAAAEANARALVLTHLSARYDTCPEVLRREAEPTFGGALTVAEDGLELDVPLQG